MEHLPVPSSSLDLQVFELTPTCHVQRSIPVDQYTQDQIQLGDYSQVLDSLRTLEKVIMAGTIFGPSITSILRDSNLGMIQRLNPRSATVRKASLPDIAAD